MLVIERIQVETSRIQRSRRLSMTERSLGNTGLVLNPHLTRRDNWHPVHGMDLTKASQPFVLVLISPHDEAGKAHHTVPGTGRCHQSLTYTKHLLCDKWASSFDIYNNLVRQELLSFPRRKREGNMWDESMAERGRWYAIWRCHG